MSDPELLQAYLRENSQPAFAAVVQRHVDLVYSAALRQVRAPHLAEEVAQSVFLDLARHAARLDPRQPLAAWLYVVTRRTAIDIIRRESRRQARERTAAEIATMKTPLTAWPRVASQLDDAMDSLDEAERTAIVLRFFENRPLREVGAALGITEDTAQKRVSRAVEQLRAFFHRRGVAVTASALAGDLSAHAVEAAPAGLGAVISSSATSGALAATHVFAMTTAQKTALAATLALVVGAGLYEANLFARQRAELAGLQRDTADLAAQLRRADQQAAATQRQIASAQEELARLPAAPVANAAFVDPAAEAEMRAWLGRVAQLRALAAQPGLAIPEMALLTDADWLNAARNLDRDFGRAPPDRLADGVRGLHGLAKVRFGMYLSEASRDYVNAHGGRLPDDPRELAPFFHDNKYFKAGDVDPAMLARYGMRYTGALDDVPPAERSAVFVEITSPDEEHDQRAIAGPGGARIRDFRDLRDDTAAALQAFARANAGAKPADPTELLPYFRPPLSTARQGKFLQAAPSLLAPR